MFDLTRDGTVIFLMVTVHCPNSSVIRINASIGNQENQRIKPFIFVQPFPTGIIFNKPRNIRYLLFKQNNLKWFKNTALIKKVMAPVYLVSWLITEVSRGWLPSQKLLACSLYLCPFPSSSPPFSSLSLSVSEWGTENIMCQDKLHSEIGHRHKHITHTHTRNWTWRKSSESATSLRWLQGTRLTILPWGLYFDSLNMATKA